MQITSSDLCVCSWSLYYAYCRVVSLVPLFKSVFACCATMNSCLQHREHVIHILQRRFLVIIHIFKVSARCIRKWLKTKRTQLSDNMYDMIVLGCNNTIKQCRNAGGPLKRGSPKTMTTQTSALTFKHLVLHLHQYCDSGLRHIYDMPLGKTSQPRGAPIKWNQ